MYVDGEMAAESDQITISPLDFKPVLNYIGRGQSNAPFFNGNIDDFKVFNYALSDEEIILIYNTGSVSIETVGISKGKLNLWPTPADNLLHVNYSSKYNNMATLSVFNTNGKQVLSKDIQGTCNTELDVSNLPSGIYILKLTDGEELITKDIIIRH